MSTGRRVSALYTDPLADEEARYEFYSRLLGAAFFFMEHPVCDLPPHPEIRLSVETDSVCFKIGYCCADCEPDPLVHTRIVARLRMDAARVGFGKGLTAADMNATFGYIRFRKTVGGHLSKEPEHDPERETAISPIMV